MAALINDRVGSREPCFGEYGVSVTFALMDCSAQKQNSHLSSRLMRNIVPIPPRTVDTIFNSVVDCDPYDKVGCAPGLVCGKDNCAKFHQLSAATGFTGSTDCCEGKR